MHVSQNTFHLQYLLYSLMCFLGFVGDGVLGAFNAIDWSTIADNDVITFIDEDNSVESRLNDIGILVATTSVSIAS